ncbi:T9SS type A sorting domain-containing protein [Aurantibacillus circumpalustris]|uniref:T9SS type A sorting domain-containing protein n=1 Tax=Aurantibacillus circumpalustris TaxID=3036359 RepID=UPI00295A5CAD|nr:T9SS type A sorting domain-containing protein [Aurantibacillus circumpalustris]
MKTVLKFVTLCLFALPVKGQQIAKLFGAHSNGTSNVFTSVTLPDVTYDKLSVIKGPFKPFAGQTTFDDKNSRYFIKSGSNILIIDATTGKISDSIPNSSNFYNIEYDEISNSIVGLATIEKSVVFKTINLLTKSSVVTASLSGVDSIVVGESTFDSKNRRYFALTKVGLIVIDSTGAFIDVLCSSPYLNGLEYDPATNKIYYLEWDGSIYYFVSIEANTCSVGFINSFNGFSKSIWAESSFDKTLSHYYNKTNLGILKIDIRSGEIIQRIPVFNYFGGLEFTTVSKMANLEEENSRKEIHVFPNPSNSHFNFSNLKKGDTLEIFDFKGQLLYQTVLNETSLELNFETESRGIYFYRIYSATDPIKQGKLLLR